MLDKARGIANLLPSIETGYYDVVLTSHRSDARYDVDSVVEVK
jgi:hypothetical protein